MLAPARSSTFAYTCTAALLLALGSLAGCGGSKKGCDPGTKEACRCSDGQGMMTCNPKGSGFGACVCGTLLEKKPAKAAAKPTDKDAATGDKGSKDPRAVAAEAAYLAVVAAYNKGDKAAFTAGYHRGFCHYNSKQNPEAVAAQHERQFDGKPTVRIDATLRLLSVSDEFVVFLQTERFARARSTPRRFFKLVQMSLVDDVWKLAAEATRSRRGCAPGIMEGISDEEVDRYKDELLRSAKIVAEGGLPASVLPTTCYPGRWDGKRGFRVACKHGRGFANAKRGWRPVGAAKGAGWKFAAYRKYGWTGVVNDDCPAADPDGSGSQLPCRFDMAFVYPPITSGCAESPLCKLHGLCADSANGCECGPKGCAPPKATTRSTCDKLADTVCAEIDDCTRWYAGFSATVKTAGDKASEGCGATLKDKAALAALVEAAKAAK